MIILVLRMIRMIILMLRMIILMGQDDGSGGRPAPGAHGGGGARPDLGPPPWAPGRAGPPEPAS